MSTTVIGYIRPRSVYEAGFSGSVAVPDGATSLAAWVQGAGGAGRQYYDPITELDWDDGGGGGGFCFLDVPILEDEWGTSITISVGSAVPGGAGGASTLAGTLNGSGVSVSAGGGSNAPVVTGGAASGGTYNADGIAGELASPGDGTPGAGGLPGGAGEDLVEPGGTGGVGLSTAENGYIALEWS
jgi:hypothetical protein